MVCMDEQVPTIRTQAWKGSVQAVEAGAGDPGT